MRWESLRNMSGITGAVASVALAALAALPPAAATVVMAQSKTPVAVDRIRAAELAAHIKFLADDLLEGRAPATRGGDLAARYIAAQFEALGLEPGGDPVGGVAASGGTAGQAAGA